MADALAVPISMKAGKNIIEICSSFIIYLFIISFSYRNISNQNQFSMNNLVLIIITSFLCRNLQSRFS